jgi:hypothetical protein
VSSLQASNSTLQNNVTTIKTQVSSLQASNSTLQGQVATLQATVSKGITAAVRGSVEFNGVILDGSGFLVSHTASTGAYTITYSPTSPFTANPSCVVSTQQNQLPADGANFYCKISSANISGVGIQCYLPPGIITQGGFFGVTTAPGDNNFQFICVQ